ncbi:MAG TPA: TRAP transporter small permease subunit [Syntrophales bacterium]|nr:TRAP transporter small permease subunit [Syntrophales bacterium]
MIDRISGGIDWLVEKQGNIASLLIIPLLFVVVYEVFMRYGFNRPTIWGFEVTMFIYGMHYMFGLSYMDHYDGHVKVDVFVTRMPLKTQLIIKILNHLIISLPVLIGLLIWTTLFGITSTGYLEKNWTSWAPYIWPYKDLMALGVFFLLLQDVSNLLKTIRQLKTIAKEDK